MPDILKTWPAFMEPAKVRTIFTMKWDGAFYFTLGRAKPKQAVDRLWYTHRGQIIGNFSIGEIVQNVGQLPPLRSISGETSEWQIKPDAWVAVCPSGSFTPLEEEIFHEAFRGWRYFDLEKYRGSVGSLVHV